MKATIVSLFAAGGLLAILCAVAAWMVHMRNPAKADPVPERHLDAAHKGLEYLAGKQHKDGHWEGDGGDHPVAMTGLAGLAFLMETVRPDESIYSGIGVERAPAQNEGKPDEKHSANIRKAADWLIEQSRGRRDGLIFSDHPSETSRYMQGHGLATLFLAGVYEYETDSARRKTLTEVLTRAVKYIADAQSTQGGWHDTSKVEGHDFATIGVTAIQVQALQAAANAGISYPSAALNDGQEYLKAAKEKSSASDSAAALACLSRRDFDNSKVKPTQKWLEECRSRIPKGGDVKFGRDELAHYYIAQSEHQFGDEAWNAYRTAMFDRLRDAQNKDGSWPAGNGTCVGQVYSVAVWCTVLQLGNNSHPSRQHPIMFID